MTDLDFQYNVLNMSDSLRSFSRKFISNEQDGNDLIQDTLLKALVYKDKFQPGTNLKAWLFTIMRNTFINQFNKKSKRNTYNINTDEEGFNFDHFIDNCTPENIYVKGEIDQTISDLSDNYSTPLTMYHEGYKYEEIAQKLEIPMGTVKNRIFTARKKLYNKLK